MRKIPRPTIPALEAYGECASGERNSTIAARYSAIFSLLQGKFTSYEEKAGAHSLHQLPACQPAANDQVVLSPATKGDFLRLYDAGMVGRTRGRRVYDQLIIGAPLGKCPYCSLGHVETLDHFVPKARYPVYSVLPSNLVPACHACNAGKGNALVTAASEGCHPYFESSLFEQQVWLYAEVLQTTPASMRFVVRIPADWPGDLAQRVNHSFVSLNLARRYATEAASELMSLSSILTRLPEMDVRRDHLRTTASGYCDHLKNSWQSALYNALAGSDWYVETGYSMIE